MDREELKQLLTACLNEMENLQLKIACSEPEGWEGSKRRCVLRKRLEETIARLTYHVT
jgi:hypothetical protein